MAYLLEAHKISKSYICGKRNHQNSFTVNVLNDVDLSLSNGEVLAIVGPSGSGKSTLLYCLSGLERADNGSIELLGRQICEMSQATLANLYREYIGFIFQSYNLIESLDALDNVLIPAKLSGKTISRERCRDILRALGLENRLRAMPYELSGGEQQRVAVGRILAIRPNIIFADEPTGALDSENSLHVIDLLCAEAHQAGRAMVLVTHNVDIAASCDRVLVLRDGRIENEILNPTASEIFNATEYRA